MRDINIFVTIGPSSLNKKFLNFINGKVSLARLNMSHVNIDKLEKKILFIKKHSRVPICIDTEGAQIRIKSNKVKIKNLKINNKIVINKINGNFNFYPNEVFNLLRKRDLLDVGFQGLQLKITHKTKSKINLICTKSGSIENNKGVHLTNRNITLHFVTNKDLSGDLMETIV